MDPSDAKKLQVRLRRAILRADQAAWHSDEQKSDKTLTWDQRLEAEQRALLAVATRKQLEKTLGRIEEALNA